MDLGKKQIDDFLYNSFFSSLQFLVLGHGFERLDESSINQTINNDNACIFDLSDSGVDQRKHIFLRLWDPPRVRSQYFLGNCAVDHTEEVNCGVDRGEEVNCGVDQAEEVNYGSTMARK